MNEGSMRGYRKDEWSDLLLIVMKTSLSVAHELALPPDAVLDCAARHLLFHDFASLASAMQGASRVHDSLRRRDSIPAVEVAYIKNLAARIDANRNVLAYPPTPCASELRHHVEAPAQAYEKVASAIQALKTDVRQTFMRSNTYSETAIEAASGFANALAAIVPGDDSVEAYERALAAVLHVRFTGSRRLIDGTMDDAERHPADDGHVGAEPLSTAPGGWMQRVKDAVHHPAKLHK
ncbi:hypothetical protein VSR68_33725 [Paraburkholderia phymatum]|uniref:hypothetical protein n=1 Tax=Paraburkholderia phymatum TaxID=148447 RepID=UPI003173093C